MFITYEQFQKMLVDAVYLVFLDCFNPMLVKRWKCFVLIFSEVHIRSPTILKMIEAKITNNKKEKR
ncbi:hypothetical protein CWM22_12880 [Streptococcus suis]|nr:hypothetical protein CWM22_12880 [Streptococcus suis]